MTTRTTRLGTHGPDIFPLALGCMGLGGGSWYGSRADAEGIATIHAALELGVNVLDTGDFYGIGRNELLIGKAIADRRDRVLLSVKYGGQMGPDGAILGTDTSPNASKNALAHSLTRLGVEHIDIYRPARLDPRVPIEDTIGALAELVQAGYVRYISLSEVGAETIARAAAVHPLCDLQIEYGLTSRGPEATIVPALRAHGMAMTAYGVLSRGLLTGSRPTGNDFRAHLPRFTGDNAKHNQVLVDALHRLAAARQVTPAQLAIAWARAKGDAQGITVIPTIGARTPQQITDAVAALAIELTANEVTELETAVPAQQVAGSRYPAPMMQGLDSER